MRRLLILVPQVVIACTPLPMIETRWPAGPSQALEIINRYQCARCHTTETVFGAPAGVLEAEAQAEVRDVKLPTLSSMERFRGRWLREFLVAPYPVRPNLTERMIVHGLTPREVDTLVTSWRAVPEPVEPPRPSNAELARGAALFEAKQCGLCHIFGARRFQVAEGWQFVKMPTMLPRALAPDLEHTRRRLTLETVEAWIANPASVKPTAQMPRVQVTREEARAIAAWVYFDAQPPPLVAGP